MIGIVAGPNGAKVASQLKDMLVAAGVDAWAGPDFANPGWAETTVLVDFGVPCGAQVMDGAPHLRAIVSPLLGYDFIDLDAATARTIAVCNGEAADNRASLAEAAIMLILAHLFRLDDAQRALRAPVAGHRLQLGRMLKGKTLGIIGSGGIARAVVERLVNWQCDIAVHSRSGSRIAGTRPVGLEPLLAESDVVLVATSLTDETHHLLDAARLGLMKREAILVNIARGAIVDERALVEVLREGRIAGAALDVFEAEPLPQDSPLRTLPNLILTPHAIGHSQESFAAILDLAARSALDMMRGILPDSCRNPQISDAWLAAQPGARSGPAVTPSLAD